MTESLRPKTVTIVPEESPKPVEFLQFFYPGLPDYLYSNQISNTWKLK